jgi:4-hydroxy-3-methylbut-2-enyl diphosphate reductase
MKIQRASHLGMCFGVRDALTLAFSQPEPLTVLGDLVHNETVLADLRSRGIRIERQPEAVATPAVMITAHGASQQRLARVRARGLRVLEATCPLVHAAHRAVTRLVSAGFHPVLVGQRDHVEVRGITEDLAEFDVVLSEAEVAQLRERPRFGVAAQTTQPIERVRHLVGAICRRFPRAQVRFVDTVCQPTKLRQHAAAELAQHSSVVLVIGGAHSNNTRELVASCALHCPRVHHVTGPEDLLAQWFHSDDTVGVTAGTSTPETSIAAVETWLHELAHALALEPVRAEAYLLEPAH